MLKKVSIIASNSDIFTAYKALNIAVAGATTGADVSIFFTFDGVKMIHKEMMNDLDVPNGKEHLVGALKEKAPSVKELVEMSNDLGVKFILCQMTLDIMNLSIDEFIDDVEVGGAVTFLQNASDSDVVLTF